MTSSSAADVDDTSDKKRRKIRKGTQSCWECKKRKIRCTYAAPGATCDGCKSRKTNCIGQDVDYDEAERVVQQRLTRDQASNEQSSESPGTGRSQKSEGEPTLDRNTRFLPDKDALSDAEDPSQALLSVWPSEDDLNTILEAPANSSVLFHGVICQPTTKVISQKTISPRLMLKPPTKDSHPVLIGRKLLLLSTYLQGICPDSASQLDSLEIDCRILMSKLFKAATSLVTGNDELLNSLEGIECVMMESMYLNNAGNLRRAWLANRRAISLAQLQGLPSGNLSRIPVIEKGTRNRIDPEYLWARLIMSDRYLSLLLSLPQSSSDDSFARPELLATCDPADRMDRMHAVAGGLIIQRNSTERTNPDATQKIDNLIREASELMDPQWWLTTPNVAAMMSNGAEGLQESIRIMSHFTHHHLLLQLHLPYIVLPYSLDPRHEYSKMTATNASRTLVMQFVSFRSAFTSTAYCRGVDFIAFVASVVLCIAHIESRRQENSVVTGVFQSLRHQKLSDRALLEQTLEIMDTMAQQGGDAVAKKIYSTLRPLLDIEKSSSAGDRYTIAASAEIEEQRMPPDNTDDASHSLEIHIPHFGTIKIEHRPPLVPDASQGAQSDPVVQDWQTIYEPQSLDFSSIINPQNFAPSTSAQVNDTENLLLPGLDADSEAWTLQGVDIALFSTLFQGSRETEN